MESVSVRALARVMAVVLGLAIAVTIALAGCGGTGSAPAKGNVIEVEGGSFTDIMPETLSEMLKHKDFLLVNVHIPYEGELEGTDLLIPYHEIEQKLSLLPDKKQKIVVYCRSGHMSALAAKVLVRLGYTNVWHLHGGMVQWEADGFNVLQLSR